MNNFGGVLADVDGGVDRLIFLCEFGLDTVVDLIIFEVNVLELDEADTSTVLELVILL